MPARPSPVLAAGDVCRPKGFVSLQATETEWDSMTCTHGYCSHGLVLTRRSDPSGLSHLLAGACDPTCSQERVIQKLEKVVEQSLQDAKRGRSAFKTVPRVPHFPQYRRTPRSR